MISLMAESRQDRVELSNSLTKQEQVKLFLTGDKERIFWLYREFAHAQASRYIRNRLPYRSLLDEDDIRQNAEVGLLDAIHSYDLQYGTDFKTHAFTRIHGSIIDGLRKLQNFPRIVARIKRALAPLVERLTHELEREPTLEEIATRFPYTRVGDEYLRDVIHDPLVTASVFNQFDDRNRNSDFVDLQSESYLDYCLLQHAKNRQQMPFEGLQRTDLIQKVLKILSDDQHERTVIYQYYFLGITSSQISIITKLSSTWVSEKKASGLRKLRKAARQDPQFVEELTACL